MLVGLEMEDVKTQEAITAALLSIQDQTLEVDVMFKIGQNQVNSLIDTIEYSKINVLMHIVGSLMTFQALINVSMLITQSSFALD